MITAKTPQPVVLPQDVEAALFQVCFGVSADVGSTAVSAIQLKKIGSSLRELWPVLAKNRGQSKGGEQHYSFSAKAAYAYAAYYLPANVMKVPLILDEAATMGVKFPESWRWLDLGSGPGTVALGARLWRQANRQGNKKLPDEYLSVDQSQEFLGLHEKLWRACGKEQVGQVPTLKTACLDYFKNSDQVLKFLKEFSPQVVTIANSLTELPMELQAKADFVVSLMDELQKLTNKDQQTRFVLFVEPGTKQASRDLHNIRKEVITRSSDVQVLLPCLSNRPCGALDKESDWCHEEAAMAFPAWHEQLGAHAELKKDQLLFSYLLMSIGPEPVSGVWPKDGMRMVSQRLTEKGLTKCYLCTESGKTQARIRDSKVTPENKEFLSCGRGQVFTSVELNEKGDVLSFSPFGSSH